jgi:hypothetical protein
VKLRNATTAAAVLAAAFLFLLLPLPPRPIQIPTPVASPLAVKGAFHVHTDRSDGSGSIEEVAAAAARAGLNFIVLADHGDGTREPVAPQYHSGVLVIDGVELSTQSGHYIAIGMRQTPYPLRGEPRDVVDDVRRFGGFGVVAHPDSAKPALRWHGWDASFDAIEWLNADTEWRDEGRGQFLRSLVRYPFRPEATIASLLDRPDQTLERWDELTAKRRVVALAGADAHARAGWMDDDVNGYTRGWFVRIPSYDASFRTFAIRVVLEQALAGNAVPDGAAIVSALKAGRVYSAIDAIAAPAQLHFAANGTTITARTNAPRGGTIVLRKDGRVVAEEPAPQLTFETKGEQGTYRVEVNLSNAPGDPPVPWIVSNPIYMRPPEWGVLLRHAIDFTPATTLSIQGGPWRVETDGASTAQVSQTEPPKGPTEFTYRLAGGSRAGQYAALVIGVGKALTERTHLVIRAHAPRPMRISVQARHPGSGARWQRSVFLDAQPRDVVIPFSELSPVGAGGAFDPGQADTILFVVDLSNANPGTAGGFTIHDLRIER